jgi:hypothetical protein
MDQDALIIREYREAFEKYARNGIIVNYQATPSILGTHSL